MTNEEYKTKSAAELRELLVERKNELGSLAFSEEAAPNTKRQLRKEIARIETFLRQKHNQQQED